MVHFIETEHEELPLEQISAYPYLRIVHDLWSRSQPALPRTLDPLEVPRAALPYVLLLDLEREPDDLRIRLAGTRVCELHGGELRGQSARDFFDPGDAAQVLQAALACAAAGRPSLARRRYVSLSDRMWGYTRLLLPLSRDGARVDSFFKVAEPTGFESIG